MKKFLFLTAILFCFAMTSTAQSLNYQTLNLDTDSWKLSIFNAAAPGATNVVLAPGASATGTISPAALPLKLVVSSSGGCTAPPVLLNITTSNPTTTTFTDSCGSTHVASVAKGGNGNYKLKVLFN